MGGITKVEKKVVSLTIECSIPTKSVFCFVSECAPMKVLVSNTAKSGEMLERYIFSVLITS